MKRSRLVVCRVCGHLEWDGDALLLATDHKCPLCGANNKAYLDVDDERIRGTLRARVLATGRDNEPLVVELRRDPAWPNDYDHASYALVHENGVVLYDAPPTSPHPQALDVVRALGNVAAIVISHADFVGCAQLWSEALGVDVDVGVWMGDEPTMPGNFVDVKHVVRERGPLLPSHDDVLLWPTPGHSAGHVAATWHEIIFAGDAITLAAATAKHPARIALPQQPPLLDGVRDLIALDCSLLCTTQGALPDASAALRRLEGAENPFARPWNDEDGGAPLTSSESWRLRF